MTWSVGEVFFTMRMGISMRGSGWMDRNKERESMYIQMATTTKVNDNSTNVMAVALWPSQIMTNTMAAGIKAKKAEPANTLFDYHQIFINFSSIRMEIVMKVSGMRDTKTGKAYINGKMVSLILASGKMIKWTGLENSLLQMVMLWKESLEMIRKFDFIYIIKTFKIPFFLKDKIICTECQRYPK